MFSKTRFSNGLRVIIVPQKEAKTAAVLVLIGTGTKYETKEINGISHFLEHMLFKGTKKRPRPIDISREADQIGAVFNAFTDKEVTGFFIISDKKHLNLDLDLLSDMILNSKFDKTAIEREKKVIIEEINTRKDIPMEYIGVLWEKLLYGNQPAGWPIAGEKEIIKKIKRDDFLEYCLNYYTTSNTVIVLAGALEEKLILKKVKNYFDKFNIAKPLTKKRTVEKQNLPKSLIYFRKTNQAHLALGVRAYDIFHPQKYALSILAVILGGNMSSRLFSEVREKKGLAYYIRTIYEAYSDTGYLVTLASTRLQKVDETISLILKEYKNIAKNLKEEEIKRAKDYLQGQLYVNLETPSEHAFFYGAQEIIENKILTPEEKCAMIDKVRLAEVKKVAQDIFRPERLNLAIIGPYKDKAMFQRLLKF